MAIIRETNENDVLTLTPEQANEDNQVLFYEGDDEMLLVQGNGNQQVGGYAGNDEINTDAGRDSVDGGLGDDIVRTGGNNDYANGKEGDDVIMMQEGNDVTRGDTGNDKMAGGIGSDRMLGGEDNDLMFGGAVHYDPETGIMSANTAYDTSMDADNMSGGDGSDTPIGGDGPDVLRGEGGADYMIGGLGGDIMRGGAGPDYMIAGSMELQIGDEIIAPFVGVDYSANRLNGNEGDDFILGAAGPDILSGDEDNDEINGGDGPDRLYGGDGDDILDSGVSSNYPMSAGVSDGHTDYLKGGNGRDTLIARDPLDYLQGGLDEDRFVIKGGGRIGDYQRGVDTPIDSIVFNDVELPFDMLPRGSAWEHRFTEGRDFGNGMIVSIKENDDGTYESQVVLLIDPLDVPNFANDLTESQIRGGTEALVSYADVTDPNDPDGTWRANDDNFRSGYFHDGQNLDAEQGDADGMASYYIIASNITHPDGAENAIYHYFRDLGDSFAPAIGIQGAEILSEQGNRFMCEFDGTHEWIPAADSPLRDIIDFEATADAQAFKNMELDGILERHLDLDGKDLADIEFKTAPAQDFDSQSLPDARENPFQVIK